jgi:hypothetical protein
VDPLNCRAMMAMCAARLVRACQYTSCRVLDQIGFTVARLASPAHVETAGLPFSMHLQEMLMRRRKSQVVT